MFLKTLYISGFKSFAYPTKINFTENINAIVGPNGSGKSNISDAIRFVLGEQRTRIMRSQSMQDIIFSGTDSENPRGMAQVRLVLDRQDQPELIVERKYYRTGESDYLLNGQKVRLKDIQAEFWDTGLGRNGYSIISQGGVENIVGATPAQLRELVEEAVGIAGYKVQQVEINRRLEQIQVNIERVSDILNEQKRQLKPLKKQAKKTRQYLKISNIIRDIDLVSFYDKQLKFDHELEEINNSLTDLNFSILDLDKTSEQKDKYYLKLKENSSELQQKVDRFLNEKENTRIQQENLNKNRRRIEQKIQANKITIQQLDLRIKERSESTALDQKKLSDYEFDLKQYQKSFENYHKITQDDEQLLYSLKVKLDELNTEPVQERYHKIEEELTEAVFKRSELQATCKQNEKTNKESKEKLQDLDRKNSQLEKDNKLYLIEKKSLEENIHKIESQLKNKQNNLTQLINEQTKLNNKLQVLRDKLNFQQQLKDNYSGFNEPVRAVMNYVKSQHLTGVSGTVRDLFTTKAQFQTAIQVALGYSAQNIVVKNAQTAKFLIDYLKKTNKGRATFLPLNSVEVQTIKNKDYYLNQEGILGFANDLITANKKYKNIFSRLLGRTLIVDTYNNAQEFRQKNKQFTLVTLEGECFYSSGAIVGGSIKKGSSQIFSPQNEINKIENQIIDVKNKTDDIKASILESEKIKNELETKVALGKKKLNKTNNSLDSINKELSLNFAQYQENEKRIQDLAPLQTELKNQQKIIDSLKEKRDEIGKQSNNLGRDVEELKNGIFELQETVSQDKIQENEVSHQITFQNERISELNNRIETETKKQENDQKQLNDLKVSNTREIKKLEEVEKQEKQLQKQLSDHSNIIDESSLKLKELVLEQNQVEEDIKELSKNRIDEVEAKNRLERRKDQIEFEAENLADSIFEKYGMTFLMVEDQIGELRSLKQDYPENKFKELRQQLSSMGSVNPNAIDEYQELKDRYEKLKENYNDLENSRKDVLNTLNQLNQTMRNQFHERFEELNKLFSKTFATLFEGGKARLSYDKDVDILETGVQLYAQPPGKNLKNINLLSGGEKAMTAIALLFSFIELNPTPFVIIDEIDAALDESNIARFTRYIDKIKDDNQFIVITHRKGTVQMCDNIHGISMASDGISRYCSFEIADYLQ